MTTDTVRRRIFFVPAALPRRLVHLVEEMAPAVIFFFIALLIILLLFKLFVAQYSVEFYAFGKAAIGALILGKVVLIMERLGSKMKPRDYPRAIAVACKTILYGSAVLAFGITERLVHAIRHTHNFRSALALVVAQSDWHRFLGFVLLISIMVGSYLAMQEIDHAMGKGELMRLFFKRSKGSPAPLAPDWSVRERREA